ncbi:MAG: LPS export ABC transporter ATP-binding protein [Caldimicrobium sp.]|nr:LPS export ABC transporter ATP-binding protein [Caldimicrobium sp.]MCX7874122.1 LPS export ABC transporter ATP-binding protein [Caldimicrobium sp.]MDW8093743.1 LPS export ABC transporter ATP-binding protein [Caldimicrobium sp.]
MKDNFCRLEAQNLKKSFKRRVIVHDVSLYVDKGEIVGLLGSNGAGKTTSFYIIAGFLKPDSGKISYKGKDLTDLDVSARARLGIIYLPQETSIFRGLTVRENLQIVKESWADRAKKIEEKIERYLDVFSLREVLEVKAQHLSGGQKRKVEILRALLIEPDIMLLDEPFAGIDPLGIAQLKEIFKRLREEGLGLLISDHNVRETLKICDRVYVMAEGVIIGQGAPETLLNHEKVREKYLGKDFQI